MSLRGWIRQWLDVPSEHAFGGLAFEFMDDRQVFRKWERELSNRVEYLEVQLKTNAQPESFHLRLTAMEATLKRLHDQVQVLGSLRASPDSPTLSEAAQAAIDRQVLNDKERRDRSAAELRGMTLPEYYIYVQQREAAKKETPA